MNWFRRLMFDLWYVSRPPWDSGMTPPELLAFLDRQPPGRALDIGCGTGTNVISLAKAGWQVTGFDFAPRAIRKAKKNVQSAGVQATLKVADATKLGKFEGLFDLALDLGCFHGLGKDKSEYLQGLEQILAPGGFWLLYAFFKPENTHHGPGLLERDLNMIPPSLMLIDRKDGQDRKERRSAYFLYQKKNN